MAYFIHLSAVKEPQRISTLKLPDKDSVLEMKKEIAFKVLVKRLVWIMGLLKIEEWLKTKCRKMRDGENYRYMRELSTDGHRSSQ